MSAVDGSTKLKVKFSSGSLCEPALAFSAGTIRLASSPRIVHKLRRLRSPVQTRPIIRRLMDSNKICLSDQALRFRYLRAAWPTIQLELFLFLFLATSLLFGFGNSFDARLLPVGQLKALPVRPALPKAPLSIEWSNLVSFARDSQFYWPGEATAQCLLWKVPPWSWLESSCPSAR